MTDPLQSDVGCGYPLKLFNIVSTVYPCHPVRQVHAPMLETEVPKEVEAESNAGFFWDFIARPDLEASKSLDYWFEGYSIDFMCLVHRLNIFDTTAWATGTKHSGMNHQLSWKWFQAVREADIQMMGTRVEALYRGQIDKYPSCLRYSKWFFCLDLRKGCAALFHTFHKRPESTLWVIFQ